jgi:hypothetical protein
MDVRCTKEKRMPRCERLDSMSNEDARIPANVEVIREYLLGQFEGFDLTETRRVSLDCYQFTVTKPKPLEQYRLQVAWPRSTGGMGTER